ncbi:hypothetical protein AGMMS50293_20500 [Spirochaetia bacterium]|nr:hypothetical protein AGMMS50293_20500 [Spirochaetia bacterium]
MENFDEKTEKSAEQERDENITRTIQEKEDEIKNHGRLSFSTYIDPEYTIEPFFSFLRERPDLFSCIKRLTLEYKFLKLTEGLIDYDFLEELCLFFDWSESTELPEYIINSSCKKEIYMHKIKILPAWVVNVKNLRSLNLSNTPLSSLPEEFFNLPSLETLDLSHTRLKEFPAGLTKMKSLKKLYCPAGLRGAYTVLNCPRILNCHYLYWGILPSFPIIRRFSMRITFPLIIKS